MPTYAYKCSDCEHLFEEFLLKIPKDEEVLDIRCPKCESKSVVRVFCAGGTDFVLKGSGWYRDGYGNGKKPNVDNIKSSESSDG